MITYQTDKLQKVLLGGGCEQRNLPSEYTQVEYLESTGTQYIDTGIVLKSKVTVTTVGQFLNTTASSPISIWGFMGNDTYPRWGCSIYQNYWLMDVNVTNSPASANTSKHTFINETNGTTYDDFIDGVSILNAPRSISQPETYQNNTLSAYIFARNNNGKAGNFSSARIYNYNIVQDDILVINLIPARRNYDSVLGMYDIVSGTFFTNAGTGSFTAGADTVPTFTTPMNVVCNNGTVKVRNKSGLPLGYKKLTYLKATGTQFINTGISGGDDDLVIDIVCKYSAWVQYGAILGNWISDGYNAARIITSTTDSNYLLVNYNNIAGNGSISVWAPKNTRLHIVLKKGSVTVNGKTANLSSTVGTANNNVIALFNRNIDNPADRNLQLEVESYSVSKNGVTIQNLVPCQRYDEVLGMYDTVSQTFLTNAGTGDFIAGNPVDDLEVYTDGTVETVEITGKNLFDKNAIYKDSYSINASGEEVYTPSFCIIKAKVLPSTQYTWSCANGTANTLRIHVYDSNGNWISQLSSAATNITQTVTTTSNTAEVRFSIQKIDINLNNGQYELGSTATTYEAYYNGGTATAENLFKVGTYQDIQSVIDGGVTRNVGVKVLDGSEVIASVSGMIRVTCPLPVEKQSDWAARRFCTHGKCNYAYNTSETIEIDGLYVWFGGGFGFTVESCKQLLEDQYANGTPVIIVYPLATPTTEQVTPQPLAGSSATVTAGSIDNLPIESSTVTKLKKRYIGDKEVKRVYIGNNLVFGEPPVYNVNMGLPSGTLWAKGNIVKDANGNYSIGNETDYGCYFSWGNIVGHNNGEGYDFGTSNSGPYASTPGKQVSGDIASNDAAHDAALATLGGSYRIPTKTEFQELYDNTDKEWDNN